MTVIESCFYNDFRDAYNTTEDYSSSYFNNFVFLLPATNSSYPTNNEWLQTVRCRARFLGTRGRSTINYHDLYAAHRTTPKRSFNSATCIYFYFTKQLLFDVYYSLNSRDGQLVLADARTEHQPPPGHQIPHGTSRNTQSASTSRCYHTSLFPPSLVLHYCTRRLSDTKGSPIFPSCLPILPIFVSM